MSGIVSDNDGIAWTTDGAKQANLVLGKNFQVSNGPEPGWGNRV
jgi:hypothetical protein